MVVADEQVNKDWAQVENQYQRRSDLIPNLVATVKGYAEHEQNTLDAVVAARSHATSITLDANNLTDEQLADFQQRQSDLSMSLGRLLAITENYPDLKANQNFLELQSQLEGTENRITVARNTFNASAQSFNAYIRRFPNNIVANMFGFEKKAYFQASEGANEVPTVAF
jgi:LemA protein